MTLLLASGDIESNPGPVQYPCTVCEKPVKRNQRGIMCDSCSQWTHARCGDVGEAEYLLLTTQESTEWFCPLCIQSKLSISNLSLLDMNTSSMLLQPQIDVVTTTLTDTKHPGVSKTGFQHSDSENRAKNRSDKDKNYYERYKVRILANRKQQYQENVEVERAASRLRAKVNYKRNPEAKIEAARVASKVNYKRNPKPKKEAARVASKVNYKKKPEAKKDAARVASKVNYKKKPRLRKMLHV